uniref:DUF4430 domain-containing protein n=1 Tax=Acanthochromis polyacanthus TaxID=80966 RepID=A0A3Q1GHP6_9TELE
MSCNASFGNVTFCAGPASLHIRVSVENDPSNMTPESYAGSVVEGGVLLGALRRLQEAQQGFEFMVKEDPDFGLLLESVNGVAGNERAQTYWEIWSENSGEFSRLDVGEYPPQRFGTTYLRKT